MTQDEVMDLIALALEDGVEPDDLEHWTEKRFAAYARIIDYPLGQGERIGSEQ